MGASLVEARRGRTFDRAQARSSVLGWLSRKSRANSENCQFFRHLDRMKSKLPRYRRPVARANRFGFASAIRAGFDAIAD
jgi:hypothetical protein